MNPIVVTIGLLTGLTILTRAFPFLFAEKLRRNHLLQKVAQQLPTAILMILVFHSLQGTTWSSFPFGMPEVLGIATTVGVHLWRRHMILSLISGTSIYFLLAFFTGGTG